MFTTRSIATDVHQRFSSYPQSKGKGTHQQKWTGIGKSFLGKRPKQSTSQPLRICITIKKLGKRQSHVKGCWRAFVLLG
jgi:hypothetical protein